MDAEHVTGGMKNKIIKREAKEKIEEAYDSMEDDFLSSTNDQQDNSSKNKKKNHLSNNYNSNNGGSSSGKNKGSNSTGSGGGSSMKCCQAEKCSADLSDAKQYHRRHKVCEHHAKAQVVVVGGIQQRFCQQCSRFHELSEFDETKRSCRRRLAGHNERRRKNSTDSSSYHTEGTSSSTTQKGMATAVTAAGTSSTSHQMKEMVCGQVDDRGRIQILSIQENANYKHFQIR